MPRWPNKLSTEEAKERQRISSNRCHRNKLKSLRENPDSPESISKKLALSRNQSRFHLAHPEKRSEWYQARIDKNPNYYKDQWEKHKDKINARRRESQRYQRLIKPRIESDPSFKILSNIRCRISAVLKRGMAKKHADTISLLGCSLGRFMEYLHAHFLPGMSFSNYGEWHVDHKIPCAEFNFSDPEHQKVCFHFTNLQPLWAADNLRKGKKCPAYKTQLLATGFKSAIEKE
jgi:hypothetical protein